MLKQVFVVALAAVGWTAAAPMLSGATQPPVSLPACLAQVVSDANTLNHIAFVMPDLDAVMRGAGRMSDAGWPIEWGVGRHGPGNNVFSYFVGPDDFVIEYTADVLQVDDAGGEAMSQGAM